MNRGHCLASPPWRGLFKNGLIMVTDLVLGTQEGIQVEFKQYKTQHLCGLATNSPHSVLESRKTFAGVRDGFRIPDKPS